MITTMQDEVPAEKTAAARRRPTMLVVDDEEGPRHSVRVIFQDDYEVLMASDGPSAIELAQKNRVDVAVLDIRMAGMSGIEVLERLKYVDPGIEVVMITAFETTDTMRQALRLRACDYLNKPFDITTLRTAVANAMQRRILERDIHNSADKVQELLVQLQNQKIEEQMSQKRGEIYASILHDINGPLTVISGFMQLLNQRIGASTRMTGEDIDFVKQRLQTAPQVLSDVLTRLDHLEFSKDRHKTITRQVTNCIEISRRYLSFLGQQTEHAPRVGVNQLLIDLGHLVSVHPSLHNNQFSTVPLAQDLAVRMNGTDVIQVLLNLTINALQCTARSHMVKVEAQKLGEALDLGGFKDSPQDRLLNVESFDNTPPLVQFIVTDDGPGIGPEILPKIFQPYFTTKGARDGTGLGLNIVQRLIKGANGALHVHTQPGKGTSFSMYLPAIALANT